MQIHLEIYLLDSCKGKYDVVIVVITRTISLRARLQPLGVGIHTHTHTHSAIQNKYALTKACMPYVVLKPT